MGLLATPVAIQEMILAVWLIIKRFDTRLREPGGSDPAMNEMESV
jgi:hypothetical protein